MAALAEALRTSCWHRILLPTTVKGESSSENHDAWRALFFFSQLLNQAGPSLRRAILFGGQIW
jgi:hypothetical protein